MSEKERNHDDKVRLTSFNKVGKNKTYTKNFKRAKYHENNVG